MTDYANLQDWENVRTRKPLIPLPVPHITGMKLQGDVMIDSAPAEVYRVDLTYPAVEGINTATATLYFHDPHPFDVGEHVVVSHLRRVPSLLNGEWRVASKTAYSITLEDRTVDSRGPLIQSFYASLLEADGEFSYTNQQGAVKSRLTLNTVDRDNVVWVCTDIGGWWTAADPEFPEAKKAFGDGSYDVSGRYLDRQLSLEGAILPPDPLLAEQARNRLIKAVDLVYKGAWLKAVERQPVPASITAVTSIDRTDDVLTVTLPGHSFKVGDIVRLSDIYLRADAGYFSGTGGFRTVVSTADVMSGIPLGSRVLLDIESNNYSIGDEIPADTVVAGKPSGSSSFVMSKLLPNSIEHVSLMFSLDELLGGTFTVIWVSSDKIKVNFPGPDYEIPDGMSVTGTCMLGEIVKASFVRLSGQPDISSETARGRQNFSVGLKAVDPVKYLWSDTFDGRESVAFLTGRERPAGITIGGPTTRAASGNNLFSNAVNLSDMDISGNGITVTASNVGASRESGEPEMSVNGGGASIWFSYTPTADIIANINTNGSNFDTILGVFTGSSLTLLSEVASDDDSGDGFNSSLTDIAMTANETYWIVVDGYGGNTGNIELHMSGSVSGGQNYTNAKKTLVNAGNYPVGVMAEIIGPVAGPMEIENYTTGKVTKISGALSGVSDFTVQTRKLDSNVATLTTLGAHNLSVGQNIFVSGVGPTYNSKTITISATGMSDTNILTVASASGISGVTEGYAIRLNEAIPNGTTIIRVDGPVLTLSNNLLTDIDDSDVYIDTPYEVLDVPTPNSVSYRKLVNRTSNVQSYSLTNGIVTITTKSDHGYNLGELVTVSDLNSAVDVYKVPIIEVPSSTTFKYACSRQREIQFGQFFNTSSIAETDQCTIFTKTNHGYNVGDIITITGSGPPYNVTNKAITAVNESMKSVTYEIPSIKKNITGTNGIKVGRINNNTFEVRLNVQDHGYPKTNPPKVDLVVKLGLAQSTPPALNKKNLSIKWVDNNTLSFTVGGFSRTTGKNDFSAAFGAYPAVNGLKFLTAGGGWTVIPAANALRYITGTDIGIINLSGTVTNSTNIPTTTKEGTARVQAVESSGSGGRITTAEDRLKIDTRLREVSLNTSTNGRAKLDARTDWITLQPGANEISTTDYGELNAVGKVTIRYRSGWIS